MMFRSKQILVLHGPFFYRRLFFFFVFSGLMVFFSNAVFAQCTGGNGSNMVCGSQSNTQGSVQFGFDPTLQLVPAAINRDPNLGPCFTCPNSTIEATSGSFTDSFAGVIRLPGAANQGFVAQSPEDQGMVLPTAPGGSGASGIFSMPLPPFSSFVFSDPEVFSNPPTQ